MGKKLLFAAFALGILCSTVHADELIYNYGEETYFGQTILQEISGSSAPPGVNVTWVVSGTLADNPFADEWLSDMPIVWDILGISLPTDGSGALSIRRIGGYSCGGLLCNVFSETINYPTDLPLGIGNSGTLTLDTNDLPTAATPEPGTWLLLLTGLGAILWSLKFIKPRHSEAKPALATDN